MTAWLVALALLGQTGPFTVRGTVQDSTQSVVSEAVVVLRTASGVELSVRTGLDGRFSFDAVPQRPVDLVVRAGGFAEYRQTLAQSGADRDITLVITLSPATVLQEVTVTAARTEQRLGDQPASVNVLDSQDIRSSPAAVADDVLRQVPAFSLFRRASSLSSHPTTQGVSLRGLGPSGVSRTLVLLDDVPFNDPFGGWVYWTRVPLESTDRVELVDGSSSSLYGNYAMGGVINIVTSPPSRRTLEVKPQYGNRTSPKIDFFGSDVWGRLGAAVEGSAFRTDGFPIVAAAERGPIDNNASVDFGNVNVKLNYRPTGAVEVFGRGGYFHEKRNNGKFSTFDGTEEQNDTTWISASGGTRIRLPDGSDLQARLFADSETFHSNFLAVPNLVTRAIGRMTLNQTVPTNGVGGMAQWSKAIAASQFLTAGGDWRWVDGDSNEDGLDAQRGLQVTLTRVSGGSQRSAGAFVQDMIVPLPALEITISARVDAWRSYDAHNLEHNYPSGTATANNNPSLPDRSDSAVSPRIASIYHLTDRVSVWGDWGGGFRAPTLNELYRQFRVGAVLTLANAQLGPERLRGGEAGVNLALGRSATLRTTWFDNRVTNPVANVTIAANTQQRQNLGSTRIWGVQTDLDYRVGTSLRVSAGYLFDQAKVVAFSINPALGLPSIVGNYVPQVPVHRGAIHATYSPRFLTLAGGVQLVGSQYDDDQNTAARLLPRYALVDVLASRTLNRNVEVFAGAQNLLNTTYIVGTLPTTIGSPRLANVGLRVRFEGR